MWCTTKILFGTSFLFHSNLNDLLELLPCSALAYVDNLIRFCLMQTYNSFKRTSIYICVCICMFFAQINLNLYHLFYWEPAIILDWNTHRLDCHFWHLTFWRLLPSNNIFSKSLYASIIWSPYNVSHQSHLEPIQHHLFKFLSFTLDGIYPPMDTDYVSLLIRHRNEALLT